MKRMILLLVIILLFSYKNVYANIKCNDGSKSRSCIHCHQGCCSGHLGCMRDENGNDVEYVEEDDDEEVEDNTTVLHEKEDNSSDWLGYLGVGAVAAAGGYALKSRK